MVCIYNNDSNSYILNLNSMSIEQLLLESGKEPQYGEIKLGIANGWTQEIRNLYKQLNEYRVDGTGTTRELGRCRNEYSFTINDGIDEYNVVYSLDSSD